MGFNYNNARQTIKILDTKRNKIDKSSYTEEELEEIRLKDLEAQKKNR